MVGGFAVSMINKFKNDEEYVYETVLGYVVDKVSIIFLFLHVVWLVSRHSVII